MKSDFALDNAEWPALLINEGGTIVRANQAAVKHFGATLEGEAPRLAAIWPAENGVTAEEFIAHWERSPAAAVSVKLNAKGGAIESSSASICSFTRDGQKFFIFQLPAHAHSETEFRRQTVTDAALASKQKLDCALQLARTVSLDFNNALTTILGHTSYLLSQAEANHPWRAALLEVEKSAGRAAEIANDLAAFSRQEKETRAQVSGNLNALLQRCADLFKGVNTPKIAWKLNFERKLFAAKFDEAKMQQAVVKVIENSMQAIKASGSITLQTRNVELTEAAQDRDLRLAAGTYVCLEINDDGPGIEPDVLPRIFEPFFTTKKAQGHRGLGLALVYGIVTNHGGGVAVSSQVGSGTSARIYLPAEKKIIRDSGVTSSDLKGTQNILMVDDEDLLLTMGKTILSAFGYTVETANNGVRALEIVAKAKTPFHLLITDLVMPGMSGRELVERLRQVAPRTRVLCTSGFVRASDPNEEVAYLQKPFTSQDLLVKVKETLTAS
jgi:two-component system cell cycle sensor histidine kinase/response regulator CckA